MADVLVENDRARGVKLADGTKARADEVIRAADGHSLVFDMFGGRYIDDTIRRMYDEWIPVQPLVRVCLGVARDMLREPARPGFELDRPITVAGEERR